MTTGAAVRSATRTALDWLRWRWRGQRDPDSLAFDAIHGTDTASFDLADYEPTPPAVAERVLDAVVTALGADGVRDASFVDLGCGKGRVLLLAAQRGFGRVLGVEHDRRLAAIGRANARRVAVHVEVFEQDAADFELPLGERVLFMYNPFPADVLEAVMTRAALAPTWLAYVHPVDEARVLAAGFAEIARGDDRLEPRWRVFRGTWSR